MKIFQAIALTVLFCLGLLHATPPDQVGQFHLASCDPPPDPPKPPKKTLSQVVSFKC
jgi:hypothetical protein